MLFNNDSKHKYCVYLTKYTGDKLPPKYINASLTPLFYIGSTSIDNIKKGYNGSIRSKLYSSIWKSEQKFNKSSFHTIIIKTFEDRKLALEYELFLQKCCKVIKNPYFINMSYATVNGFFGMPVAGTKRKKRKTPLNVNLTDFDKLKIKDRIKGTVSIYNTITGETFRIRKTKPEFLINITSGKWIYTASLKSKESYKSASEKNKNSKHYYNPETGERVMLKEGLPIPENFIRGNGYRCYNFETGEQKTIYTKDIPDGFIKGNFINDCQNYIKGIDVRKNEYLKVRRHSILSVYIIPENSKYIYRICGKYYINSKSSLVKFYAYNNIKITFPEIDKLFKNPNYLSNAGSCLESLSLEFIDLENFKYDKTQIWDYLTLTIPEKINFYDIREKFIQNNQEYLTCLRKIKKIKNHNLLNDIIPNDYTNLPKNEIIDLYNKIQKINLEEIKKLLFNSSHFKKGHVNDIKHKEYNALRLKQKRERPIVLKIKELLKEKSISKKIKSVLQLENDVGVNWTLLSDEILEKGYENLKSYVVKTHDYYINRTIVLEIVKFKKDNNIKSNLTTLMQCNCKNWKYLSDEQLQICFENLKSSLTN